MIQYFHKTSIISNIPDANDYINNIKNKFINGLTIKKIVRIKFVVVNEKGKREPWTGVFNKIEKADKWFKIHGVDFIKEGYNLEKKIAIEFILKSPYFKTDKLAQKWLSENKLTFDSYGLVFKIKKSKKKKKDA